MLSVGFCGSGDQGGLAGCLRFRASVLTAGKVSARAPFNLGLSLGSNYSLARLSFLCWTETLHTSLAVGPEATTCRSGLLQPCLQAHFFEGLLCMKHRSGLPWWLSGKATTELSGSILGHRAVDLLQKLQLASTLGSRKEQERACTRWRLLSL